MEPGHLLHSALTRPSGAAAWRLKSRDTHLYPPHNNSSVCLTTTQKHSLRAAQWADHQWNAEWADNPTTPHFNFRHRYTHTRNDLPKKSLGPAQPPPHRCRTFPLLHVQMGYGFLCGLWVWRRTNRRPCRPPLSNPSDPPRTTRPDGSGQRDNRMAAQHLPRYPGGLAVDKRTRSNERRLTSIRSLNLRKMSAKTWILQHWHHIHNHGRRKGRGRKGA